MKNNPRYLKLLAVLISLVAVYFIYLAYFQSDVRGSGRSASNEEKFNNCCDGYRLLTKCMDNPKDFICGEDENQNNVYLGTLANNIGIAETSIKTFCGCTNTTG